MSEVSPPQKKKIEFEFKPTEFFKALISLASSPPTALKHILVTFKLKATTNSPEELGWELINSALLEASADMVRELATDKGKLEKLTDNFKGLTDAANLALYRGKVDLAEFFDKPKESRVVELYKKQMFEWATFVGIPYEEAKAFVNRLDDFLAGSLHNRWREDAEHFAPLKDFVDTPFKDQKQKEQRLNNYRSSYIRKLDTHSVFGEAFGLRDVYMPLRGYYEEVVKEEKKEKSKIATESKRIKIATDLQEKLTAWVKHEEREDAIRVISGGPGSWSWSVSVDT